MATTQSKSAALLKTTVASRVTGKIPTTKNNAVANATAPRTKDALTLLKSDHAEAKKRFKAYEKLVKADADGEERKALADEVCAMLSVHAQIEEEIFYPAAREVLGEGADLIDEADVEHASAKALIAEIEAGSPDDMHFDARVKVLGEYIDHHVKEEHDEIFPKVQRAGMDTKAVGRALAERKAELMNEQS